MKNKKLCCVWSEFLYLILVLSVTNNVIMIDMGNGVNLLI